jgi:phage terminase large subunit-like protein
MTMTPRSTNPVDAYARRVVAGELPAGKYHRLACARHLRDRAREGTPGFPFRFVWEVRDARVRLKPCALRFLDFARQAKHYKGRQWAGHLFEPTESQVFRLGSIFGWRHIESGYRRFTTAYNELPRKQGKSFEAAIVAIYAVFFEGEPGAEGYVIATKEKQAKIVFNDAKKLVAITPALLARITVSAANLHRDETSSKLEPLGSDSDTTDGLNPYVIVVDELHAFKVRDLLDVMESATGARDTFLNFQITTAGNDLVSPCGDQHDYACKILDGVLEDDASTLAFFAFIAHADVDDDWLDERTWQKANPHFGLSVNPDDLRKLALKAKNMPSAAAEFKQKRLNLWVNTNAPWLSLDGWRHGQTVWSTDSHFVIPEELRGRPCCLGVDLSSKIDLTAIVAAFPPVAEGSDRRWRLVVWALTPEDTVDERALRDRAPYRVWIERGFLRTNPGNRIDQGVVVDIIREAVARFDVQQIGFDPWNAGNLEQDLQAEGFPVVEIPQTLAQMSGPAKDFEADVLDGLVDAGGHPLMAWCISNVVVQRDGKDNIYPVKKKSRGRIDPVIAALMARKLAAIPPPAEKTYEIFFVGGAPR